MRENVKNHDFGKKVFDLRKVRGLSQQQVSDAVGFKNKASIGKIENGNQDVPLAVAYKYAECLGVRLSELVKIGDEPFAEYVPYFKQASPEVIFCIRKLLNMQPESN